MFSKKDTDIVCIIYDILIIVLAVPIILMSWYMLGGYKTIDKYLYRYKYPNDSVYKIIDNANNTYIHEFLSSTKDSSNLESPIAIQKILYDYNISKGTEDGTIFEAYKTGYKDFANSKYVVSDKSVSTFKHWGTVKDKTKGAVSIKKIKGIDTKNIKIAGLCIFNADAPFHKDNSGTLYYQGYCDYYSSDTTSIYGIPINNEYELYLIQGSDDLLDKNWQTIKFTKEYKTIGVNPFSISSYSNNGQYLNAITKNGKLKADNSYANNITINYFDLSGDTLKKDGNYDNISSVDATFSSDFMFVVKNIKSGIIIQLGNSKK